MNPDKLRVERKAVQFVKSFFDPNKPVAAICRGHGTIVEAGAAPGRRIGPWPSIKTDLRNAGAMDEKRGRNGRQFYCRPASPTTPCIP